MLLPDDLAVTHHTARINGVDLHYVERGEGPLVVLLHGFPDTWWTWRYQIEPLAWAGFRVVAPDLRGYGDSEGRGPYDLDTLAGDLRGLLDHLGAPRARIVGHDWGGAVAWHFAGAHPTRVERLAVLNCPHPGVMRDVVLRSPRQMARSWYMFYFLLPRLPERALTGHNGRRLRALWRAGAVDPAHFSNEEVAPMVQAALRPGVISSMLAIYRTNVGAGLRDLRHAFRNYAPIAARTLIVWGMDDPALGFDELVPPTSQYVRDLTVERVARCGHFVQAERPDEVNRALVDFLGEDARTQARA